MQDPSSTYLDEPDERWPRGAYRITFASATKRRRIVNARDKQVESAAAEGKEKA